MDSASRLSPIAQGVEEGGEGGRGLAAAGIIEVVADEGGAIFGQRFDQAAAVQMGPNCIASRRISERSMWR
ncbi:hypothetical protein ASD04_06345 [Devosia sp. Root436]|nr:hypothetical protein ASD04_06345 [Devosia sp. Root436]